jgi:hypothetical protein
VLSSSPAPQSDNWMKSSRIARRTSAPRHASVTRRYSPRHSTISSTTRPGVRQVDGRVHYHLRHSRNRVPKKSDRVSEPRHLIVARVIDDTLVVLAVAHDAMEDELMARIQKGEAKL